MYYFYLNILLIYNIGLFNSLISKLYEDRNYSYNDKFIIQIW